MREARSVATTRAMVATLDRDVALERASAPVIAAHAKVASMRDALAAAEAKVAAAQQQLEEVDEEVGGLEEALDKLQGGAGGAHRERVKVVARWEKREERFAQRRAHLYERKRNQENAEFESIEAIKFLSQLAAPLRGLHSWLDEHCHVQEGGRAHVASGGSELLRRQLVSLSAALDEHGSHSVEDGEQECFVCLLFPFFCLLILLFSLFLFHRCDERRRAHEPRR